MMKEQAIINTDTQTSTISNIISGKIQLSLGSSFQARDGKQYIVTSDQAIGAGSFGSVWECTIKKESRNERSKPEEEKSKKVVKLISGKKFSAELAYRECLISMAIGFGSTYQFFYQGIPQFHEEKKIDLLNTEQLFDQAILVMPNYGCNLLKFFQTNKLVEVDLFNILIQVARQIKRLHSGKYADPHDPLRKNLFIIHRDIKFANILVQIIKGKIKVTLGDYGLALIVESTGEINGYGGAGPGDKKLPSTSIPEKKCKYSFKNDIYLLGVLIQKILKRFPSPENLSPRTKSVLAHISDALVVENEYQEFRIPSIELVLIAILISTPSFKVKENISKLRKLIKSNKFFSDFSGLDEEILCMANAITALFMASKKNQALVSPANLLLIKKCVFTNNSSSFAYKILSEIFLFGRKYAFENIFQLFIFQNFIKKKNPSGSESDLSSNFFQIYKSQLEKSLLNLYSIPKTIDGEASISTLKNIDQKSLSKEKKVIQRIMNHLDNVSDIKARDYYLSIIIKDADSPKKILLKIIKNIIMSPINGQKRCAEIFEMDMAKLIAILICWNNLKISITHIYKILLNDKDYNQYLFNLLSVIHKYLKKPKNESLRKKIENCVMKILKSIGSIKNIQEIIENLIINTEINFLSCKKLINETLKLLDILLESGLYTPQYDRKMRGNKLSDYNKLKINLTKKITPDAEEKYNKKLHKIFLWEIFNNIKITNGEYKTIKHEIKRLTLEPNFLRQNNECLNTILEEAKISHVEDFDKLAEKISEESKEKHSIIPVNFSKLEVKSFLLMVLLSISPPDGSREVIILNFAKTIVIRNFVSNQEQGSNGTKNEFESRLSSERELIQYLGNNKDWELQSAINAMVILGLTQVLHNATSSDSRSILSQINQVPRGFLNPRGFWGKRSSKYGKLEAAKLKAMSEVKPSSMSEVKNN